MKPESEPGSIPVVDMAEAEKGPDAEQRLASKVGEACESTGFLVIEGHGVKRSTIADMYAQSAAFFALPIEEKLRCTPQGWDRFCGFAAVGRGADPAGGPPDLREMYHVNRYDDVDSAIAAGLPVAVALAQAPNLWPEQPSGFKTAWLAYYQEMEKLATRLLDLFAAALDLPRGWFDPLVERHLSNLSANWYPPQLDAPIPGQVRSGAHVDFSLLTILYQDDAPGGLQVQVRGGDWIPVPHRPGSFVVNLGDLTNRLTNDRWVATPHRVVNPAREHAERGRISLPYFVMPGWEAVIECVPTCKPADGSAPKYPTVIAGPHAEERRAGRRAPTAV